jgi:hypothetical protein
MLLEQLGLEDVAGENVSALVPGYFLHLPDAGAVPRRRRDPARPHRVRAIILRVESNPGNAALDDLIVRPAAEPVSDTLAFPVANASACWVGRAVQRNNAASNCRGNQDPVQA